MTRPAHRPRPGSLRAALVAVLVLVVAACGSSTAPTPVPTATPTAAAAGATPAAAVEPAPETSAEPTPSDAEPTAAVSTGGRTGRIELPAIGLALTLPDGWTDVPLDEGSLREMADALPADSPYREMLEGQMALLIAGAMKLLAYDLGSPPESAGSSISILSEATEIPPTLLRSIVESSLGQMPGMVGTPALSDVTVDDAEAIRTMFTLAQDVGLPTGPVTLDVTQVYLSRAGRFTVVTVGVRRGAPDVAPDVLASLELLD